MFDWFTGETLATVLLVIVMFQFRRISGFTNLLKIRLRAAAGHDAARSQMPDYRRRLFECAEQELAGFGFEAPRSFKAAPFNMIDPRSCVFYELYWQPQHAVLARVEQAEALSGQITKIQFYSMFRDGFVLLTVNRECWAQFPAPEEFIIHDYYTDNLTQQWQAHLQALAAESVEREVVRDPAQVYRREAELGLKHWLAHGQRLGWFIEYQPECYRLTAGGAWNYVQQLNRLTPEVRQALARPYRYDPAPAEADARLAEMDSIGVMIALAAEPMPTWIKTMLFVLTLAASAIFFGYDAGLMSALALLTVLLVHEFGHLAAMWLCGYRNLSVFFLPFFGAAAVGHKPEASTWQEALVLLAGPVFGLLVTLAVSLLAADITPGAMTDFVQSFVLFGLVLNLLNLLPVGMLDGGRLFELAVLGRFPYARAAFVAIGAGLGLIYAFWSNAFIFGLIMLLIMLGVPLHFKAAKVVKTIQRRFKQAGLHKPLPVQALQAIGEEFAGGGYGATGARAWNQRLNIARIAYPRVLQGRPGLAISTIIVLAHLMVVLATIIFVVWSIRHPELFPVLRPSAVVQAEIEQQYLAAIKAERQASPIKKGG